MAVLRVARWARRALTLFLVAFIGIQFVRPDRTNPPTPAAASLLRKTPPEVTAVLERSCRDCHSNETRWPWYSYVAPASWLIVGDTNHGRDHFNFSEWTSYTSDDQDKFLGAMCNLTQRGRMPQWQYLLVHPGAKLSAADVKALCAWSDKMRDTLQ
jgi:heme-binding protein